MTNIKPNQEGHNFAETTNQKIEKNILIDAYFQLKKTTSELTDRNRVLKILSEVNIALIHSNDESSLLNSVSRILTSLGGYQSVWIGITENFKDKAIRPVSYVGYEPGYLESFNLTWEDNERGVGPEGVALRSGKPIVKRNISEDPEMVFWRQDAIKHGYKSLIALPLMHNDKELGVLNIYSDNLNAFDDAEVEVLRELSNNIAYGIFSLRINEEHKCLEEELLKASTSRYKSIFSASRDAIMTLEPPSWDFTSGNQATILMFRAKNEDEFLNNQPWQLSPEFQPDGRKSSDKAKEMIDKAMIDGTNFFEWTHKRMNGEIFPCEISLSRIDNKENSFLLAIIRDITERKKLEDKLKEYAEEKFKAIFDGTAEGMIVADPKSKHFVFGNRAMCEMLGYTQSELSRLSVPDIHPKENLDFALDIFNKQGRGELKVARDIPVQRKDKSVFFADIVASSIVIDNTKFILGVFRDISERKLAEEVLRESEEKYSNLIENIPDSIFVYDTSQKIIFLNKEGVRLLGAKNKEEIIGQSAVNFIHPDSMPIVKKRMTASVEEKKILPPLEEKFLRINRSVVEAEVKSMPIKFENKQATLVLVRDITERKALEESKISFLSIASHQLRTPLAMMKWLLDSLLDNKNLDPKELKKLNNLYFANEKIINLVEKLLKASMIETGELISNKMPVDLNKLVTDLLVSLKLFSESHNKIVNVALPQNIITAICDPILISEALKNLITNAVIYSKIDSTEINVTLIEREKDYLFSVRNDGYIDEASSMKMNNFNKFSRGTKSPEISPSGSGLGLYISKKMVETNGGLLWFTSNIESGTTFYFTILK